MPERIPQAIRYGHRRCGDLSRIAAASGFSIPTISSALKSGMASPQVVAAITNYYTKHKQVAAIKITLLADEQKFILQLIRMALHSPELKPRAEAFIQENSDIWHELLELTMPTAADAVEYSRHYEVPENHHRQHDGYTRWCPECRAMMLHYSIPYQPQPELGDVWVCSRCEHEDGWVQK